MFRRTRAKFRVSVGTSQIVRDGFGNQLSHFAIQVGVECHYCMHFYRSFTISFIAWNFKRHDAITFSE